MKDPTLWFPKLVPEITDRLDWLFLPKMMHEQLDDLERFTDEIRTEGFNHIILLGMGGSSLAPEVFQNIFGSTESYPELIVLDSTHPSAIKSVEMRINLESSLFLVASKSGTTIETLSLYRYFWKQLKKSDQDPGRHFVAITDPGSPLVELAKERRFRTIFEATPNVGGRYSALTLFGLVPASLIGMNIHRFLDQARAMSENLAFGTSSENACGLELAASLGELAEMGKDKATFFTSSSMKGFPIWLEQLIAESTGKNGKGIVPIVDEPITTLENYGDDRFFIYFHSMTENNQKIDEITEELIDKGYPIIKINLTDTIRVAEEIYCWEVAVAAAGSILHIHPFNQPNVQIAKNLTRRMMDKSVEFPQKESNVETISAEKSEEMKEAIKNWLSKARRNDYIAIQAYLAPTEDTTAILQSIRQKLLNHLKLATTLGYGPRFLHSTGQLHKGGPNTGLFLQLVDEPEEDLEVPETTYTFGDLIQAQALGDYEALRQLGRRTIRINLGKNVKDSLAKLHFLLESII